jgi:hypothetical protein
MRVRTFSPQRHAHFALSGVGERVRQKIRKHLRQSLANAFGLQQRDPDGFLRLGQYARRERNPGACLQ